MTLNTHWLFTAMVAPVSEMPVGLVVVRVPPQTVAEEFATVKPVGSVSLKATPVRAAVFAAGLVMVNCSDVVAFRAMLVGLKTLAMDGGANTDKTAVLLVVPVPPSVDVTAPVVLLLSPALVPVTETERVQVDPAAGEAVNVPPVRLMAPVPAVAVGDPPQVFTTLGEAATTRPEGSESLKPTPLRVLNVFGLTMVKVTVLLAFKATLVGLNALPMVGGATTAKDAFDVLPEPANVSLAVTLLFFTPAVLPFTVTVTVQFAPGARVAPDKLTAPAPSAAEAEPVQLLLKLPGVATISPAGSVSVNETPFNVKFTLVLLILIERLVVVFSGMLAAPKVFRTVGGLITVRVAVAGDTALPASEELSVTLLL